ncbi:DUF4038 domain-containing protein [Chryseolinea sp. T2]|uniref:apiosidase-like domain-containing protein n=1 Tax=Chryseolinea sp. T2 TaxID=3129255 RepID=UPI003077DC38
MERVSGRYCRIHASGLATSLLLNLALIIFPLMANGQAAFPLKISPDNRYLMDQNNKPFPILGRTAWFVVSQSEEGYKKFISNTLQHGYNSIELSVITHWPMGNHAPFNAAGDLPFLKRLDGTPWRGQLAYDSIDIQAPDLTTPNETYWQFVDNFLGYCESKGVAVFMFPGYVGYEGQEQGWMKELMANKDKTEKYGAWIASRYRNRKNIVWMLLGDMGKFNQEQERAESLLIKGLKSVAGQSTEYTAESHSGENAADNVQFGREMTLNGCYTWELKVPVPHLARRAYAHKPVMPAFLLEEPYDEEGPDGNNYNPNATQPVRRFQWWGWLSTIGGYISGNAYVWQFVDPVWEQHLNTQGAMDMERLNAFINSIRWWDLIPSGMNGMKTLVTNPANIDSTAHYVSAAATKDGSLLIAYLPPAQRGSISIDLSALAKKSYGYWYDPTSAKYSAIPGGPFVNKGKKEFNPPGLNSRGEYDWVLMLTTDPSKK